jgi:hypothetical protein
MKGLEFHGEAYEGLIQEWGQKKNQGQVFYFDTFIFLWLGTCNTKIKDLTPYRL